MHFVAKKSFNEVKHEMLLQEIYIFCLFLSGTLALISLIYFVSAYKSLNYIAIGTNLSLTWIKKLKKKLPEMVKWFEIM